MVELSSLECEVYIRVRAPLQKKKKHVSHAEILLCHHRIDKASSGRERSAEVLRSIAERGRVREGESRIAVLCEFCQRTQSVQHHRELHSNLNSLRLNERPKIH